MNIKTISFGLLIAILVAVLTAVLTVVGTHALKDENSLTNFISLFKSQPEEGVVEFVEIKNVIITLKSNSNKERYLLLELALTTNDPHQTKRTEEMTPAIRGATVSLLSDLDYNDVRTMNTEDLRKKLMVAYQARFKSLNSSMPFKDVIISKMVFQ